MTEGPSSFGSRSINLEDLQQWADWLRPYAGLAGPAPVDCDEIPELLSIIDLAKQAVEPAKANSARDPELDRIQDLAERIYAEATMLDKAPRHLISNAARLIQWECYRAAHPDDREAQEAVTQLRASIASQGA